MKRSKDEYLMLRDEILQLNTLINNTINFFYVFVSAALLFAIGQEDSMYVLMCYVVIIPAYLITLSKQIGLYKIASYLYVFQEGEKFNWERRMKKIYESHHFSALRTIQTYNYPFLFVSTFVTVIFLIKTEWSIIEQTVEFLKLTFAIIMYVFLLVMVIRNRKITIEKYIPYWEKIKNEE